MQLYSGVRTDSSRWSEFDLRDGDVIVSTPPKCGTTWMMAIVAMLLRGSSDLPEPISVSSPWLDYSPVPLDGILDTYASQGGRRLIKTHTPVDGLPVVDGTHMVSVLRNPLDALRSMRRHVLNMAHPLEGDPFLAAEEDVIKRGIDLASTRRTSTRFRWNFWSAISARPERPSLRKADPLRFFTTAT